MDQSSAVASELRLDELSGDEADTAAMVLGQEHESVVAEGLQRKMAEVEHALSRLSNGDYGRCERCGRMIPTRRLVAFPSATLCVECKQREER
jgi:DnaK suppressor protein